MRPHLALPLAALTALALAAPAAFAGPLDEFQMPAGSQPSGIAKGPDGNVWVAGLTTNQIIRVTPSGEVTPYPAFAGRARPARDHGGCRRASVVQ